MKKILLAILVIASTIGAFRVYSMKSDLASRYTLTDLQAIAAESNKSLPVLVDQGTRLDAVVAHEGILEKRYTLVSSISSDINASEFTEKLGAALKSESCRNEQSLKLYRSGVSESFTYSDMNGQKIATITIDKKSCP